MDDYHKPNRKERRAAESRGEMTDKRFLQIADKFIDTANRENEHVSATELHMAFLYAAARYNAHVAKNVLNVEEHEPFVEAMMKSYQEMLRNHLADPSV
jgi:chromatin segregation and condensation protein Rec8/ScpA/Scc1 (kleisin family)